MTLSEKFIEYTANGIPSDLPGILQGAQELERDLEQCQKDLKESRRESVKRGMMFTDMCMANSAGSIKIQELEKENDGLIAYADVLARANAAYHKENEAQENVIKTLTASLYNRSTIVDLKDITIDKLKKENELLNEGLERKNDIKEFMAKYFHEEKDKKAIVNQARNWKKKCKQAEKELKELNENINHVYTIAYMQGGLNSPLRGKDGAK